MHILSLDRLIHRDPQRRAQRALARRLAKLPARRSPDAALQAVTDLSKEITGARYAALAITDRQDRTEGFSPPASIPRRWRGCARRRRATAPSARCATTADRCASHDVRQHAKAFGFPPAHPEMQRLCGVAIWARGEVRGALYIADRTDGQPFTKDDEATLTTHAAHVVETEWY